MSTLRQLVRGQGFGAMVGVAVMLVAFTLIDFSGWWTAQTMSNVIHFSSILALIAMGQALVIMSKEIDLSVGSVYGLTGVAFITLQATLGVPGAIIAALIIAALCGFIQAVAVVKGGLPSMIVTLGGLFTFRGIIYVWTGGSVRASSRGGAHALADGPVRRRDLRRGSGVVLDASAVARPQPSALDDSIRQPSVGHRRAA